MTDYEDSSWQEVWRRDVITDTFAASTDYAQVAKVGDRVQLHPATDWWMRGAKYGEVTKITTNAGPHKRTYIYVKLDKAGAVRLAPRDIYETV